MTVIQSSSKVARNFCLIIFLIYLLNSCLRVDEDVNKIITNSALLNCLNKIIAHEDSMRNVYSTYGEVKSYAITFSRDPTGCYVELEGDGHNYDSQTMIGYFSYKSKFVSVYGLSSNCGRDFINTRKLKKGLIVGLSDYNPNYFYVYTKAHLPVPPPPSLVEPYYRKYLIVSHNSFKKVEDYDEMVRSFKENKYLK
jgi:hypothetical protein